MRCRRCWRGGCLRSGRCDRWGFRLLSLCSPLDPALCHTAVGVPHANPQLVYVPDDPRLGRFRSDFANMFCFLEEREPGNGKKTYNMTDLDQKIQEDNDNTIDQQPVLRARMLDMFVMDFDRHEDQWRWVAEDNGKGQTFSPVPKDPRPAFFYK